MELIERAEAGVEVPMPRKPFWSMTSAGTVEVANDEGEVVAM